MGPQTYSGDHYLYGHPAFSDNLPIPDHRELRSGTLRDIIRRLDMSVSDFLAALKD